MLRVLYIIFLSLDTSFLTVLSIGTLLFSPQDSFAQPLTLQPPLISPAPRLRDASLRCCVIYADPFAHRAARPPWDFDGLNIDFFLHLKQLTGFRCSSFAPFNATQPGVGWSEYLNMTAACALPDGTIARNASCPCDIAAGTWFDNEHRHRFVRFLPTIMVSDFRMITHVNNTHATTSAWLFVDAFSPAVWVSLLLLAASFTLVKALDPHFLPLQDGEGANPDANDTQTAQEQENGFYHNAVARQLSNFAFTFTTSSSSSLQDIYPRTKIDASAGQRTKHFHEDDDVFGSPNLAMNRRTIVNERSKPLHRPRKAAQSTLMAMVGNVAPSENRIIRQWGSNYAICLFGLIIALVYEATMTARLVQQKTLADYRSMNDILDCTIPHEDICIVQGDIVEELWTSMFANRPCAITSQHKPRLVQTYDDLFAAVHNESCKFALSESGTILAMQHGLYCGSLVTVGRPFGTGASAMIAPHNWPYFDEMRAATLRIVETSIVAPSVEEHFAQHGTCTLAPKPQLTFKQLRVFFFAAFIAWAAILLFILFDYSRHNF